MAFLPKVRSKEEEDKDETKPLRNPINYIQFAAVPKQLTPHSRQRTAFHSDLHVSARNDKLRAGFFVKSQEKTGVSKQRNIPSNHEIVQRRKKVSLQLILLF